MRYFIMAILGFLAPAFLPAQADLLLDDFHDARLPTWGTRWEGFTDRVMGGLTEMTSDPRDEGDGPFLRIQGRVRTENNGGFLQMRLVLKKDGKDLDGRPWSGVRLIVRGAPGTYAVHLRTGQTWFPWNFYGAPLPVTDTWAEVRLPFEGFRGQYGASGALDRRTLQGVAVVAIGSPFDARLDVKEIGLFH